MAKKINNTFAVNNINYNCFGIIVNTKRITKMDQYIPRMLEPVVMRSLKHNPITAIIGPRQCGKSRLARKICSMHENSLYLDLQEEEDLSKIKDGIEARAFLEKNMVGLICLDEVGFRPDIFRTLKGLCDIIAHSRDKNFNITHPARFLAIGSASPLLLRQPSESLTGRISYKQLTTFLINEIPNCDTQRYIVRGAYPDSYYADNDSLSLKCRQDYIKNFLESDILTWCEYSPATIEKLWNMLIATNGQRTTHEKISKAVNIPPDDIVTYIDFLEGLFLIDRVRPYSDDVFKRLGKSHKIYVADSGMATAKMNISSYDELAAPHWNKISEAIWESIVLAHLRAWFPDPWHDNISFYRDKNSNEIDFILKERNMLFAIECKTSKKSQVESGWDIALNELGVPKEHAFVVAPLPDEKDDRAVTLPELRTSLDKILAS
jgi:predicted AAA+ superfamily ATPase